MAKMGSTFGIYSLPRHEVAAADPAGDSVHIHQAFQETCMPTSQFGTGSFAKELWINNKAVFGTPASVNVEFVTTGPFDWVFADSRGKEVKTVRHDNAHGGWTSINTNSLGLSGTYSIGFRNASSGMQTIKQGDVTYS